MVGPEGTPIPEEAPPEEEVDANEGEKYDGGPIPPVPETSEQGEGS